MTINITCAECDNEVDVAFDLDNAQLDRRCFYCGFGLPHVEILAANIVAARTETRQVAAAFAFAMRAFAKTIEGKVPLAPAYADGVLKATAEAFGNGPVEALR